MNVIFIAIGLLALTFILLMVAYIKDRAPKDWLEDIVFPFMGAALYLAGTTFFFLLISMLWHDDGPTYEKRVELRAAVDSSGIHGSLYLGSGRIGGDLVYNYYVKNDDGSFSRQSISARDVKVFENSEEGAWLKATCTDSDFSLADWGLNRVIEQCWGYEFHVPPGTVADTIEMDNQ